MDCDILYDEEEDEYFFQSISRYNILQMFNLENVPQHLLPLDDFSICIGSQRKKGENSELLKLKLPAKLTLPPEEEGRCKENDFKVLSGVYTENLLHQIDKLNKQDAIIASENHFNGLQVYSFTDCLLGTRKNQEKKLNLTPWSRSNFTIIQETVHAVCCKSSHEPLIEVDLLIGEKLREIKHPFYNSNILPENFSIETNAVGSNNIKCKALDTNLIAVLNRLNGCVVLFDLRTSNDFNFISKCSESISKEIWSLSDFDFRESPLNYFGVVSNKKSFYIYDKRKNSMAVQSTGNITPNENSHNMTMKINNKGDKFSISGMNSFVEIYKINNGDFQHVFTHNGHCPRNLPSAVVIDHMWLQTAGNEYVVSICQNGTLNCWDYKA